MKTLKTALALAATLSFGTAGAVVAAPAPAAPQQQMAAMELTGCQLEEYFRCMSRFGDDQFCYNNAALLVCRR